MSAPIENLTLPEEFAKRLAEAQDATRRRELAGFLLDWLIPPLKEAAVHVVARAADPRLLSVAQGELKTVLAMERILQGELARTGVAATEAERMAQGVAQELEELESGVDDV